MQQPIVGFDQDELGDWRAILACGHRQHVRHNPPFVERPWVLTEDGRRRFVGHPLDCKRCDEEVMLPDAPAVPGLIFRSFRGSDDYADLTAVINASNAADGEESVDTVEGIASWLEHIVNADLSRDMLIAEVDGAMIGLIYGYWRHEVTGRYRYQFALLLQPEWRGLGIEQALLHWMEARLRCVATEHPAGAPKVFATLVAEQAETTCALLAHEGYTVARYYHHMVRPLAEPIPDFAMPPGIELRPVLPEHVRAIWDASNEAFLDHWSFSPRPEAYYDFWRTNPVTFRPELWQVAWDSETNEIAGQIQTYIDAAENEAYQRRRGYTETISVRRPYRRRGLARAMIVESLRTLKAQGMIEAALHVDAENTTGATRIYEACGFVTHRRAIAYGKPLDT